MPQVFLVNNIHLCEMVLAWGTHETDWQTTDRDRKRSTNK